MFVLELTYTAPLDRVDVHAADHAAWLDTCFAQGRLLAAGRKVPRDGGVLLAPGGDRAAAEALTAEDPYVREGVCAYRITEFAATRTAQGLEALRDEPRT